MQPSDEPSIQPSICPTTHPSLQPSKQPSSAPTEYPTEQPSSSPSRQPSVQPFAYPTEQPSNRPSSFPSMKPSNQPSIQPSVKPSTYPSNQPSRSPSSLPSKQPSNEPSRQPSSQPTGLPSVSPTQTFRPTSYPTSAPTAAPSSEPTGSPTLSDVSMWTGALRSLIDTAGIICKGQVSTIFNELKFGDVVKFGGSQEFSRFIYNELEFAQEFNTISSIQLYTSLHPESSFTNATCSNDTAASLIIDRLTSPSSNLDPIKCHDSSWGICRIKSKTKLCVGCVDPCPSVNSNMDLVLKDAMDSCSSTGDCLHSLIVCSKDPLPAADITSIQVLVQSKSAILVTVEVDAPSYVYCAAYASYEAPSSVEAVLSVNNVNRSTNGAASILLHDLSPSTNYAVHCATKSGSGSTLTYEKMLAKSVSVSTVCCKIASISWIESQFTAGYIKQDLLKVELDSPPSSDLSIGISQRSYDSAADRCRFSPVVSYRAVSSVGYDLVRYFSVSCGSAIRRGAYEVEATLDGSSSSEYELRFPFGKSFTILDPNCAQSVAPDFSSAIFSSDGASITVSFTIPTNKAGLPDSFMCSNLLQFPGVLVSSCRWIDNNRIVISWSGVVDVNIGSTISLALTKVGIPFIKKFTGLTPPSISCSQPQLIKVTAAVTVQPPYSPIIPVVSLSAASRIGSHQVLLLDISSSYGGGGKPWASIRVQITSTKGDDASSLSKKLESQFANGSIARIPASSLPIGIGYSFFITLCNFFGKCGSGQHLTYVSNSSVPVATIFGSSVKPMKASDQLYLTGNVSYQSFEQSMVGRSVVLSWSILQNGIEIERIKSKSTDPFKYLLPSFVLTVKEIYVVRLTAFDPISYVSSECSVTVLVQPAALFAVISGGSIISISLSRPSVLDASRSYDSNLSPTARYNDINLSFQWKCFYVGSNMNTDCPILFDDSTRRSPSLSITPEASKLSVGDILVMTVSVTKDTRASVANIQLVLQSEDTCSVAMDSFFVSKVNAHEKIKILSAVSTSRPSELWWSCSASSVVDLTAIASTTLGRYVDVITPTDNGYAVTHDLVVRPNSLMPGVTYTFQLTCKQGSTVVSSSALTLIVNSPPSGGLLDIDPSRGIELWTYFALEAKYWVDADLPLAYQFVFLAPSNGAMLSVQSKSEISHATTLLPVGNVNQNYSLTVVVCAYDAVGASSNASLGVTVEKQIGAVASCPEDQLVATLNNSALSKSVISLCATALNSPNCSLAPSCSALHRTPCSTVDHTCGACLEQYIGDIGDANSLCFLISNRRLTINESFPIKSKRCWQDCSGRGECLWLNRNTGRRVSSCLETDVTCYSMCQCSTGYRGTICSVTEADQRSRISTRQSLVAVLSRLITFDIPDQNSISAWIAALSAITQVADDVSNEIANDVVNIAETIISIAAKYSIPNDISQGLSVVFDRIPSSLHGLKGASTGGKYEESMELLLKAYGALIAGDMVVTEQVSSVQSKYRIITSSIFATENTTIMEPVSKEEQAANSRSTQARVSILPSQFAMSALGRNDWVTVSIVVYRAADFSNRSMNANPVGVLFHGYSSIQIFSSANVSLIEVSLKNIAKVDLSRHHPRNLTTVCKNRRPVVHSYQCPAGLPNVTVTCTGEAEVIETHCPNYQLESVCVSSSEYDRLYYDENETVCSSSWPVIADEKLSHHRRYLSSAALTGASISLTSQIKVVPNAHPFPTSTKANAIVAANYFVVATAVSIIVLLALLSLPLSIWADNECRKSQPQERNKRVLTVDNQADSEFVSSRRWLVDEEIIASDSTESLKEVLVAVLPQVFRVQPFWASLWRELKCHHRLLSIAVHYSLQYSRLMRLINILTQSNVMLLFVYVFIEIFYSVEESACYCHFYEKDCLKVSSAFDPSQHRCQWDSFYNTCKSNVSTTSAITVIAITCICQMVSIPIAINVEHLIKLLAVAQTRNGGEFFPMKLTGLHSVKPSDDIMAGVVNVSDSHDIQTDCMGDSQVHWHRSITYFTNGFATFRDAIGSHCASLSSAQKAAFLEHLARMYVLINGGSVIFREYPRFKVFLRALKPSVVEPFQINEDLFRGSLRALEDRARVEADIIDNSDRSHKAPRLLLLFILDMLPRSAASIVRSKADRDRLLFASLSTSMSVVYWMVILVINVGSLGYVLTMHFNHPASESKQFLWVMCVIFWMFFEALLGNVLNVLFTHLLLPSLVVTTLSRAISQFNSILVEYLRKARKRESQHQRNMRIAAHVDSNRCFDYVPFFTLSNRVAQMYSQVRESRIVRSMGCAEFESFLLSTRESVDFYKAEPLSVCGQMRDFIMDCSVCVQDVVISLLVTLAGGLICVLHVFIYRMFAELLVIPASVCVLVAIYLMVRNEDRKASLDQSTASLSFHVHDAHSHVIDFVGKTPVDLMSSEFFLKADLAVLSNPVERREKSGGDLSKCDEMKPASLLLGSDSGSSSFLSNVSTSSGSTYWDDFISRFSKHKQTFETMNSSESRNNSDSDFLFESNFRRQNKFRLKVVPLSIIKSSAKNDKINLISSSGSSSDIVSESDIHTSTISGDYGNGAASVHNLSGHIFENELCRTAMNDLAQKVDRSTAKFLLTDSSSMDSGDQSDISAVSIASDLDVYQIYRSDHSDFQIAEDTPASHFSRSSRKDEKKYYSAVQAINDSDEEDNAEFVASPTEIAANGPLSDLIAVDDKSIVQRSELLLGAEESSVFGDSIRSDEVGQGQQKDNVSAAFRSMLSSSRGVLIISDDEDEDDKEDDEEEDEFQLEHDDDIDSKVSSANY